MKGLKKDTKEIIFELIRLNAPRGVQEESLEAFENIHTFIEFVGRYVEGE